MAGVRVTRCGFIVIIGAHMSPYSYCELHLILKITLSDIATTKTARLDFMADLVLFKGVVLIVQDDFVMPLKLCMDAGVRQYHLQRCITLVSGKFNEGRDDVWQMYVMRMTSRCMQRNVV